MIAFFKEWLAKSLSSVVLVGSLGVMLYVVAGGLPTQQDTAADVSTGEMLQHLLAGSGDTPRGEADFEGCWTEIPPPSREELEENLRRSLASKNFRRYNEPATGEDQGR